MQTELPVENVPSDEDFEKSLVEFLQNEKHYMHTVHGQMLDAWYADENAGPVILIEFAKFLADDFEEELEKKYPKTTIFSLLLNADGPDTASYFVIISHKNFGAIAMFGAEMSPEQFATYLEIAKAADNEPE